ncbi:MAG: SBBP repeat-containing protein, partial [Actinomycetota bacterium]
MLAKYSAGGVHVWSKRLGGSGGDFAHSVASDPSGAVLVAGSTFSPSIDMGGGPLSGLGEYDMVLAGYSSSGDHLWSKRLGGTGYDFAYSVASDPLGAVLLAGYTQSDSIDLGGGPLIGTPCCDMVLAKYAWDGTAPVSKLVALPVVSTVAGRLLGTATDTNAGVAG